MTDDIDDLAKRATEGDDRAFARVVDLIAPGLLRLARRLVGPGDADDVVQESLTRIYVALRERRYRAKGKLPAWAARITTRVALDALRADKRRRARERAVSVTQRAPDPSQAGLTLAQVQRALEALPPNQRVALVLKEIEGMSTREIATSMDCSEGAVEQRLVRARSSLRARWRDD